MVEWRTHLASLGAVFLALALGLVIGLGLGGDDAWIQRQQAALDRIEEELDASRRTQQSLLARQEELVQETEAWEAFATKALPLLVRGRLEERAVGVVTASGKEPPQALLDLLKQAGAEVVLLPSQEPEASAGGRSPSRREAAGSPRPVDALLVVAGAGTSLENWSGAALLPEPAANAPFQMLVLPDRFPGREVSLPEGWAAVGPLDHPAAAAVVVLGLAARRPGRYGWSPEGPWLP